MVIINSIYLINKFNNRNFEYFDIFDWKQNIIKFKQNFIHSYYSCNDDENWWKKINVWIIIIEVVCADVNFGFITMETQHMYL